MPQPSIHLVNPFSIAFAGSERRTLGYYKLLSGHADVERFGRAHVETVREFFLRAD